MRQERKLKNVEEFTSVKDKNLKMFE